MIAPNKCKTCVFNGSPGYGNPHHYRVVKEALSEDSYVECHTRKKHICKGFNDAYPMHSNFQRICTRLSAIKELKTGKADNDAQNPTK